MSITEIARKLRKNQTKSEKILWSYLRNRKLSGKKFLRQFPLIFNFDNINRFFIADFYCSECKLVIEVDGKIHDSQKEYDNLRTQIISQRGIKVIRFTNEEVENNISFVLSEIKNELNIINPSLSVERGWGELE